MVITGPVSPAAEQRAGVSRGVLDTPVGVLVVESDGAAIRRVGWSARAARPSGGDPLLAEALAQVAAYFAGSRRDFDLPLDLGPQTEVTLVVLRTLFETVDHGETMTYGELAERSGTGVPARAIGSIMGANPIPLIVPCHRVVASDGLGGYSGGEPGQGLSTKRWLLEHEGALPAALF
ncbi:methylated-DNA--[protein]-cysteine S-methyltransferase [uncultured Microbacterium sp.]|uniref:methylated-DNA--[protein]-cysteine S-methyltransferase n=1 Tax=uncultured Microbacterium sp. TaxID=191216 RepID=UPI0025F9691B|nr:methylated-DNA--[protein]-cysteine S-methyltransferase [uncultured Microbacterium sp.]